MKTYMKISDKGKDFIKKEERCVLHAYRNHPKEPWTIGYGNTFYEDGTPVKRGDVITIQRADKLFDIIVTKFERDVNKLVTAPSLTQNQFDMLVSFAYNCGSDIDSDTIAEGLGDSTLLKYVNANPNDPRIAREFDKWISKGSIFEKGLRIRRRRERTIYFSKN